MNRSVCYRWKKNAGCVVGLTRLQCELQGGVNCYVNYRWNLIDLQRMRDVLLDEVDCSEGCKVKLAECGL